MKNEKTGVDERCAECQHYKPDGGIPVKGWCTLHWRLNQKWDTRTEYDLWCQHWELIKTLKTQHEEQAEDRDTLEEGVQSPGESDPIPMVDRTDVVYAVIQELTTQVKELSQMDHECVMSIAAAAKSGDRMALAEMGAMLRAFDMIRVNVQNRINVLRAQIL